MQAKHISCILANPKPETIYIDAYLRTELQDRYMAKEEKPLSVPEVTELLDLAKSSRYMVELGGKDFLYLSVPSQHPRPS